MPRVAHRFFSQSILQALSCIYPVSWVQKGSYMPEHCSSQVGPLKAGATGAGQGYIWLAHRQPGTAAWDLAAHSKRLWEERCSTQDSADLIEWQV